MAIRIYFLVPNVCLLTEILTVTMITAINGPVKFLVIKFDWTVKNQFNKRIYECKRKFIHKYDAVVDGQSHENSDQIVFAKICRIALVGGHGEPVTPENLNSKSFFLISYGIYG